MSSNRVATFDFKFGTGCSQCRDNRAKLKDMKTLLELRERALLEANLMGGVMRLCGWLAVAFAVVATVALMR